MPQKIFKLFRNDSDLASESIDTIAEGKSFKLEHIISRGESSDSNFWYEQEKDEWVALIAGKSTLTFEDASIELVAGDAMLIPAMCKHRVSSTSQDAVWIALHFE